jgi:hypothetical protein
MAGESSSGGGFGASVPPVQVSADRLTISGRGIRGGTTFNVYDNGAQLTTITAAADGTYSKTLGTPLGYGRTITHDGLAALPATTTPSPVAIAKPAAFDFTMPYTVQRFPDGTISHTYDIVAAKPAYTGTIYVGPGGVDTADGLTYANRVRSLRQAIVRANARAAATRLLVDPATYKLSDVVSTIAASFGALSPTVDIVIEPSAAGKIISLADVTVPAFVATATDAQVFVSTYTTQAVGQGVIDLANLNAKGRPKALRRTWPGNATEATIVAALQARHTQHKQGAYYLDTTNKKLYVRTIDARAPDANIVVLNSVANNLLLTATNNALKVWMDSVECWGSSSPYRVNSGATGTSTTWARNSGFCYSTGGHGYLIAGGGGTAYSVNCVADDNSADGFDYNGLTGTGGASPVFHEFNCSADYNGWANDGDSSYNGSTCHANCRGVRINCSYTGIANRPIHDIQDAQTWNLGCSVGPNIPVTGAPVNGPYASVASGYPAIPGTSKIWLDSCSLSDANPLDFLAYAGGQIFYANMRTPRVLSQVNDAGSAVSPYTA